MNLSELRNLSGQAVIAAGLLMFLGSAPVRAEPQKKPGPEKPVPVVVAKTVSLLADTKIELPGTVLPWAVTRLASEVNARVESLSFNEGQYVKKGTPLVQLRTHPLKLQRDLAMAEKIRVAAKLEELRTGTRAETIEAAKASLEQARARVKVTQNELLRASRLYEDKVLSLHDFDRAKAEADEAKALAEQRQAVLKELEAGPRIEEIRQEEANLQAAEARIAIIEDDIQRSTIHAPFNGYVLKKETETGQWLEKGDPAVSMIAVDALKAEINLPQFHFNKIEIGTPAKIILEGRGAGRANEEFKGEAIEKIYSGDPASRTFPVRVKVINPNSRIAAGMLVRVELYPEEKRKNTLYVPKDAVVRTPRETSVWVVREDKDNNFTAMKVAVETGDNVEKLVAVKADPKKLKVGEWVVVQGNERLPPEVKVNVIDKRE
ncbi:MAG: efflux RND transporter periplasmic adaptor subunit [Nitrospinae bacterium]|nr:efflux RND transporter periplasmic adaptor subunit [Nitrospinota bacterium]